MTGRGKQAFAENLMRQTRTARDSKTDATRQIATGLLHTSLCPHRSLCRHVSGRICARDLRDLWSWKPDEVIAVTKLNAPVAGLITTSTKNASYPVERVGRQGAQGTPVVIGSPR